ARALGYRADRGDLAAHGVSAGHLDRDRFAHLGLALLGGIEIDSGDELGRARLEHGRASTAPAPVAAPATAATATAVVRAAAVRATAALVVRVVRAVRPGLRGPELR